MIATLTKVSATADMKKLWKVDGSDRLSLAVLAFCLLMLAGVVLFR